MDDGRLTLSAFRLVPPLLALAPWPCGAKVFNAAGTELTPGPQPTERLYSGQIWDWNANVHHYVARVYVPDLARFTSTDPVREYANPYAYVGWRPTGFIDPDGREMTAADALSSISPLVGIAALGYGGPFAIAARVAIGAGIGGATAFFQPDKTVGSVAGGILGGGSSALMSPVKTVSTLAKSIQAVSSTVGDSAIQSLAHQTISKCKLLKTSWSMQYWLGR